MATADGEEEALRSVALRNANAIHLVRQRADEDLRRARDALESRTLELGHSLSLMRATLEATADGILVTSSDGRVVTYNEKFLEMWGINDKAAAGASLAELLQTVARQFRDPARIALRLSEIQASPATEELDVQELADGRVFERYSRPQQLDAKMVGRVWSYRDVTARTRVEEAARDEARVLDLLNRTGTSIASSLDLAQLLQTVTDAATELSGAEFGVFLYSPSGDQRAAVAAYTVSGTPPSGFDGFAHARDEPLFAPTFNAQPAVRCDDLLQDTRAAGQWPQPSGARAASHRPVRSYLAVPVASRSGATVGGLFFGHATAGVFTERSERLVVGIAAQAAVAIDNATLYEETRRVAIEREGLIAAERAARAEIARVSSLKDEFLATLSHELRTPLTAILGWARVLLRKKVDPETLARGMEAIERNAVAQARLIEDLLDMNRIVSGKVRLDVQPTDLTSVIDAAIDAVRPAAEARGIRLRTIIDPRAGPVSGDPNRLQQVLWNLLTNAVKFTPKGGKVDVALQRVDSHLELSVSDSGAGIDAEFLPHVFDRFRQADSSTTRSHGGLGLGLSIVKQLVELHGGNVRAMSEGEGRGATFVVCVPLAALLHEPDQAHPETRRAFAPPAVSIDLRGVKVLVVDDEPDARDLIRQLLQECHAEVHTASSAREALATLQGLRPDLLLSDIGMPERDGYQLIRDVRRLAPDDGGKTPAIALTAFARSEDRTRAMLAGYQVHVSKPIEPHELIATVASLAGRMG